MAKRLVGKSAKPKSGGANARRNPYGKAGAAKRAAEPKKGSRWAKNAKDAQKRARATAEGMSAEARRKTIAEGKKLAKKRADRIRDIGQAIPKGYLRRQGGRYFVKEENYRADRKKNSAAAMSMYHANKERVQAGLRSASNQGQLHADGTANFRKTPSMVKMMNKHKAYALHPGKKMSKFSMVFGSDGKAP